MHVSMVSHLTDQGPWLQPTRAPQEPHKFMHSHKNIVRIMYHTSEKANFTFTRRQKSTVEKMYRK